MRYLETLLARDLRLATPAMRWSLAEAALEEAGRRFEPRVVETLAPALKDADPRGLLALMKKYPDSPNAAYLAAVSRASLGDLDTIEAWRKFFALHDGRDPVHVLAFARALLETGDRQEAALQVQMALSRMPPYSFFARAQKPIESLAVGYQGYLRQARIAVLGSSTTSMLVPVLKALCFRDRIQADFYQGLYGAIDQEILDPQSGLHAFQPSIVLISVQWRDLDLPAISADETAVVEGIAARYESLWTSLRQRFGCHVIQQAFDSPGEDAYGYLAGSLSGGRSRIGSAVNQSLLKRAPSNVSILDTPGVQRRAGEQQWADAMLWHKFKQHPANAALPMLGEECAAHIRAVLGLTRKVLITDLDNTLWKGVIGEDGLDGIGIGPDSAEGEAHAALQSYMLDLKARGILLAVASKNNPEDARLPFQRHPHMRLRLEDFAAFEANWNDKASNIRAISEKLSLGLDSFVFLDDNPLEREWVRSQLPQVAVVEPASNSVFHFARALDQAKYFFALSLSQEDLSRAEQYRIEAARDNLRAASSSMGEFLAQLNMRAAAVPVSDSNISRVVQLINKTNQFNLTTQRYTEAQVRDAASNPAGWARAFELSDRMGSYGLIGVVMAKPGRDIKTWVIDTWLMSCRALGREMENFMFDRLMAAAQASGVRRIEGVYRPTPKNNLVAGLLERFGFERVAETGEETRFVMDMPDGFEATASHIQNTSGQETAAEAMA